MPEGDTLFRAARRLHQALAGQRVERFTSRYAHLSAIDDQSPLAGRYVLGVRAAGKHVLMELSGDLTLHTHMRMNGSWHLYRPGERWQRPASAMRLMLATAAFEAVGFDIPVAELLTADQLRRHPVLTALGPDLLAPAPAFDPDLARARIATQGERAIAEVLLDQRVLAGAGNVFKSEILFLARLDPFRAVATLSDDDLVAIVAIARRLLAQNVTPDSAEGIVTRRGVRNTTGHHDPGSNLWVYGRGGEPCRECGAPIAYRKQGLDARGTYWCPRCQR